MSVENRGAFLERRHYPLPHTPPPPQIKHHLELSRQAEAASASVNANDGPKKLSLPTRTEPQPSSDLSVYSLTDSNWRHFEGSVKNTQFQCSHVHRVLILRYGRIYSFTRFVAKTRCQVEIKKVCLTFLYVFWWEYVGLNVWLRTVLSTKNDTLTTYLITYLMAVDG